MYRHWGKVKCTLVQPLRLCTGRTAQRVSRGIALPFHDHGTRRGWGVSVTPWPLFTPGKDPVPILQEAGWASGPVWTGVENLALHRDSIPDRPARSQSLYRLRYPAHTYTRGDPNNSRESLAAFYSISVEDFRQCFQQFQRRCDSCIQSQRDGLLWRGIKCQNCTNILNTFFLTILGIFPPRMYVVSLYVKGYFISSGVCFIWRFPFSLWFFNDILPEVGIIWVGGACVSYFPGRTRTSNFSSYEFA